MTFIEVVQNLSNELEMLGLEGKAELILPKKTYARLAFEVDRLFPSLSSMPSNEILLTLSSGELTIRSKDE